MKKTIKAFIIASVLLNILMAGVIFGNIGRHFFRVHERITAQELAEELPQNKRKLFEETMRSTETETGEWHQQLSDARKQAANILKAEPFDANAYLTQMQKIQDVRNQIMQKTAQSIATLAAKFTQEERATLSEILNTRPERRHDGKNHNKE